jgi:hypothetical protein
VSDPRTPLAALAPPEPLADERRAQTSLRVTRITGAFAFRFLCYGAMAWLALWAEARPAPANLPDAVLAQLPFVPWVARYNYLLWLLAYVPLSLWLLGRDADRFIRYMVTAGCVALARGLCIAATGLGPVTGPDVNAGLSSEQRWTAFWRLVSPVDFFGGDAAHVYLTKDLFFSGHTATTFLLLLYVWRDRALRWPMLACHLLVVASVFLARLHYTIDVIGAYAITFAIFVLREGDLRGLLGLPPARG